ncbi:MAG: hypothetical protein ACD_80C00027G0015 [uncultured bacterium (gcode 4)]|uniref:Uncharacterized protein n=1 Tax=uncultured bacterium (gcode 4) TaxID=1234023 RepID=K1XJZ4_9BACT|nr:MAG: hypothetical protein ACD_80C00027G0015 [uncultured bacterium (gcode 4)]HBB04279.1 hypothetical protein [Candidatus Gracilibacteria bacterium]
MYPLENHLCNQLDLTLAFKIITLSLAESNRKDDDLLKVDGIKKMSTENLLEEKFEISFQKTRVTCTVIFKCVIQDLSIKYAVNHGMPRFYYQGVEEINFESKNETAVQEMQGRFEKCLKKIESEAEEAQIIPTSLISNITLRSNKRG